jgi:hypothetical protein
MKMKKELLLIISLVFSCSFFSQQGESLYGGEIKLKITYDGYPLIGYTVTGKINDIAIGPSGVTNENGDVTICSDPLPIPDISVEGVKKSGNNSFSWSASGFVRVLKQEGNLFHLDLKKVSESVAKMMGMNPLDIAASYGVSVSDNLGAEKSTSEYTSASIMGCDKPKNVSASSSSNNNEISKEDPRGSGINSGTSTYKPAKAELKGTASKEMKDDFDKWERENDEKDAARKARSDAFHANAKSEFASGQGFDNQAAMYRSQIAKINDKIVDVDNSIMRSKKSKEKYELMYEKKELLLERQIKQTKLDKTNAEIANNRTMLNKSERTYYKEEIDRLEDELKDIKKDRKNKKPITNSDIKKVEETAPLSKGEPAPQKKSVPQLDPATQKEPIPQEESVSEKEPVSEEEPVNEYPDEFNEENIKSKGVLNLKGQKFKMESKVKSIEISLKTQGKLMAPDKKEEKEKELESLQRQIILIAKELEERK